MSVHAKDGDWRDIAKVIGTVAAVHLRQVDLAFEPSDDGIFRILLPNTTAEEARIVAALLVSKADEELRCHNMEVELTTDVRELDAERLTTVLYV